MKKRFLVLALGLTMGLTLSMTSVALAANTSGSGTNIAGSSGYPIVYPNGDQVPGNDLTTTIYTGDTTHGSGLTNANQTGAGTGTNDGSTATQAAKVKPNERVHGEYQNNTDSCASCHQVHTAAGSNLTFKDNVYDTCIACHDGTLGVLNVFQPSTAGTFGGTAAGNASMHLSTDVMTTEAAPGGNHTSGATGTAAAQWTNEFDCASCHSPHGSYSDRLLNYNPNSIGSTDEYFESSPGVYTTNDGTTPSATPVKTGGLKLVKGTVYTTLPDPTTIPVDHIAYSTTSDSATLGANGVTQEPSGTAVIVLMMKNSAGNGWVRDMSPWINDSASQGYASFTNFYDSTSAKLKYAADPTATTSDIILKLGYGYAKNGVANGLSKAVTADISRAVVVKFDFLSVNEADFNGLPIKQVDISSYSKSGYGVQIAQFCASCHTDYLAKSGSETGVWSQAFRHTTTSDTYACLKCHFGHGTDVSVMLDAKDQSVASLVAGGEGGAFTGNVAAATNYMLDVNPSSALKRYTNMSICWKCHTSSHSGDFINNEYVQGGVNTSVKASTEYDTAGTNVPTGWVDPVQSTLPYYIAGPTN